MDQKDIFDKERTFLSRAQGPEAVRPSYEELIKAYKKLLKQSNHLVRISDRQQLELVELNELKNKFVGMAGHDLRNPAGLISGFSEVLLADPDMPSEEQTELLTIINDVSEGMLKLLGDLLDVSAIESGKLSIDRVEGRLDEMVNARVNLLRTIADQKNISITLNMYPITIKFDADRLGQVVDNLISNAIKFSHKNTDIKVTVSSENNAALITVSDEGQGIPADEVNKIFSSFERLSVQPTGGEKSHGLGMAIVKKIVGAHNGQVDVESQIGEGSTFSVSLPLN